MGVDVVVGGAIPDERAAIESLFRQWDLVFSRFRPDSELSLVNASPAEFVVVSPLLAEVIGAALAAAARTDGLVDRRSAPRSTPRATTATRRALGDRRALAPTAPGSWRSVRLAGRLRFRVPGTKLDLNAPSSSSTCPRCSSTPTFRSR